MNKKAIILISLFTSTVGAAPPVTHQFTNGTTIEASQINSNYQELADRIETLQNQVVQLQNIQPKQLVGFTIATVSVGQTQQAFTLHQLCQSEYPNSSMCTSQDIKNTINIPALVDGTAAWIYQETVNTCNRVFSTGTISSDCGLTLGVACCR